jgi:tRNA (guanine-N7-)-methyltransferase
LSDKQPEKKLHRPIRSFVRRQGRMSDAQNEALKTLWPEYGLELPSAPYNFATIFSQQGPLCLEIGFGMGESLVEMAKADPNKNFIGVEVHKPGIGNLLIQIAKHKLGNIRIFNTDVNDVLLKAITNQSLDALHIFFPDPWQKKRHHKRRLIQPEFSQLLRVKLKIGGILHLATDWEDYAHHMMKVLSNIDGFVNVAGHGHFSLRPDYRPLTKFEKRGEKLGHKVWDLLFVREF